MPFIAFDYGEPGSAWKVAGPDLPWHTQNNEQRFGLRDPVNAGISERHDQLDAAAQPNENPPMLDKCTGIQPGGD